jgi:hypothetical protein
VRWARNFDEKQDFRFNVKQELQEIGLEGYKKKGVIEAATEGYLTHMTSSSGCEAAFRTWDSKKVCISTTLRRE